MQYVYWKSEPGLWTAGYYSPDGQRHPESDHNSEEAAAARVHWLNGGKDAPDEVTSQNIKNRESWALG